MAAKRPNILIVTTDQQRSDSLGCYGGKGVKTPEIDALADQGIRFDRAYCAAPVCTPARASLFSGKNVSSHGAWNVGTNVDENIPFLSHLLQEQGYVTHYIGKAHFQAYQGPAEESRESHLEGWEVNFDDWSGPYYGFQTAELAPGHTMYGMTGHYGLWVKQQLGTDDLSEYSQASDLHDISFGANAFDWTLPSAVHNSKWVADRTISFLDDYDGSKPFLMSVGFQDPHHPHCVPTDYQRKVSPADMEVPFFEPDEYRNKPRQYWDAHSGSLEDAPYRKKYWIAGQEAGHDYRKVDDDDARLARAYYYTMVHMIDDQMGRILHALQEKGLRENTIVVFTSDHGELLGDHGIWLKGPFHYEELIRVPLIISWPAAVKGGGVRSNPISHTDLAPTLLSLLDIDNTNVDGNDRSAELSESNTDQNEYALIECVDDPSGIRMKTLVGSRYKITYYLNESDGELYDLVQDPREVHNLWDDPAFSGIRVAMLSAILKKMESHEARSGRIAYA